MVDVMTGRSGIWCGGEGQLGVFGSIGTEPDIGKSHCRAAFLPHLGCSGFWTKKACACFICGKDRTVGSLPGEHFPTRGAGPSEIPKRLGVA